GDDQLRAGQAALDQAAQEAAPERFGLALADVEADHLAVARLVYGVGKHERLGDDAATVADLLDLGVQPEIGVAALERPVAERLHLLVEALADPRDLALGDPQPQRLDQLVDLPRRDAGDIGLLHDRDQRLLAAFARLQERREIAAPTNLRDRELDLASPGRPAAGPVAVAVSKPLRTPLTMLGTNQLRDLRFHQLLHDPHKRLAQEVETLALDQVADDLLSRHPLRLGHRGDSSRQLHWREADDHERHGGRTTTRLRPTLS